jgi:hypothetical protein
MYTLFTSSLGGKYTVGISTANGNAAKKTARDVLTIFKLGMFKRTYITGTMGTATMHNGENTEAGDDPAALKEACALGGKLARDIITKRAYPLQNLPMRLAVRLKIRPFMRKYVINNKDGRKKAVYENLLSRGLI